MRLNLGLIFTTLGWILLAIPVFRWGFDPDWKRLPWLERWFYKLFGDKGPLEYAQKRDAEIPALLAGKLRKPWWTERRLIIAGILMILIGFFVSFDYWALARFLDRIF